jgi:hypothetical protein
MQTSGLPAADVFASAVRAPSAPAGGRTFPYTSGGQTGLEIDRQQMCLCLRKIRRPAGVIQVHMGEEDVRYIRRIPIPLADLVHGRFLRAVCTARKRHELLHGRRRFGAIALPPTGVDQHQSLASFDQQAMKGAVAAC